MRSPISALTWEIFRSGLRSLSLVAAIITICTLISLLAPDKQRALESLHGFYIFLMVCTFFLVFGIFHHAEFNLRKNWHGFPYRLFTLPVPTWLLVGIPMILGLVSVELAYLAWAKLVFAPLGKSISFWPAAALGSGIVCYQALVWSLAGFRITRIIALGFMGILFLQLALMPYASELFRMNQPQVVTTLAILFPSLAIAAFLGGWFSVERQRRGGGRGRGWLKARIIQLSDALPRRQKGFTSMAAAQFWFEWRRAGLLLPVSVGFVLLMIFLPISWFTRTDPDSTLWTLGWALALPTILATAIGKVLAQPVSWSPDMAVSQFLAVRPISCSELVATKMKVAALSVTISWLLVLVFLALWLPLWSATSRLKDLWDTLLILHGSIKLFAIIILFIMGLMLLSWRGMVSSFWIGLSGNMKFIVVSALVQIVLFGAAIVGAVYWLKHFDSKKLEHYVSLFSIALTLAVLLKLWLAAFAWRKITPSRTRKYMLLWTIGTASLVLLAILVCPDIFWLKHLFILAALLPFPLARLGLAPLSLAKNRHRP